jgi:hypothetical protein
MSESSSDYHSEGIINDYAEHARLFDVALERYMRLNVVNEKFYPTPHLKSVVSLTDSRSVPFVEQYEKIQAKQIELEKLFELATSEDEKKDIDRALGRIDMFVLQSPKPFTKKTVLELSIPSGKLVISDCLNPIFTPVGYESAGALHNIAVNYIKNFGVATARVESSPSLVFKNDGRILIADVNDEDDNEITLDDETVAPYHRTGTYDYAIEMTDYTNWLNHGGENLDDGKSYDYTLLDVEKGRYRWIVMSHSAEFDSDLEREKNNRVVYAELELIETY